jgi:hypothetical protein
MQELVRLLKERALELEKYVEKIEAEMSADKIKFIKSK